MKKFSDFSSEGDVFDGEKVKLATLLDKEICILQYKIRRSKYQDKHENYAIVQFTETDENGEHKIFFTGSGVVMEQLEKYEDELPFQTTLKKIDKYLTLS